MTDVPSLRPETRPPVPTDAIDILPLLQAPPLAASLNVMADPTHTGVLPAIADIGLTVTALIAAQLPSV